MIRLIADPMHVRLAAEYDSPEAVLAAAERLRRQGYRRLDAYVPFEVEGLGDALGVARPRLAALTFTCGAVGAAVGYLVQWYCNSWDYPLAVGGRPMHPVLSYVPVAFETMVLFAGVGTFIGLFAGSRLPEPWNPLFDVEGFERASVDRYWLGVDGRDPLFDAGRTHAELSATSPLRVVAPDALEAR